MDENFFYEPSLFLVSAMVGPYRAVSFSNPDVQIPVVTQDAKTCLPVFTDSDSARRFIKEVGIANPLLTEYKTWQEFYPLIFEAIAYGYTHVAFDGEQRSRLIRHVIPIAEVLQHVESQCG
jgi:hypothetical protein